MMEYLYDTHFHLDLHKDRWGVIREIEESKIYTIAVTNLPDLYRKESAEIASRFIRFSLGFHPELIHQYKNQIPLMWELLPETRYIGEVGLDFVDKSHKAEQLSFFSELIERCRYDGSKILTIHSRQAVKEVLEIIGHNFRFKPILHWFTGNKDETISAIEAGFYFSVNEAMMRSKKFMSLLPLIPADRLLIESDSPFLRFKTSHSNTLLTLCETIKDVKTNVTLWENFKAILQSQ